MPFDAGRPWWFLLGGGCFLFIFWISRHRSLAGLPTERIRLTLITRGALILLLTLALARVQIHWPTRQLGVVYLLDVSDSMGPGGKEAGLEFIRRSLDHQQKGDVAGLVVLGQNAYLESLPVPALDWHNLHTLPNTRGTNLKAGLRLALAALPLERAKRIVLLSDGQETTGKSVEELDLMKTQGIAIDTIPLSSGPSGREVLLEELTVPFDVNRNEPFNLKAVIYSTHPTSAVLRVFKDNQYVGEQRLVLREGRQILDLPQQIDRGGLHAFRAVIESTSDTHGENNQANALTMIKGPLNILLIDSAPSRLSALKRALEEGRANVSTSRHVPESLSQWLNYDLVGFSNVPAWSMPSRQMELVKRYVKDLGGGFAMIGGEKSFGMGGYYKTAVEDILPVSMEAKKRKDSPSMAIILAIDKSGSMGAWSGTEVTKFDLAKEAALQVINLMQAESGDEFGVVFFDSIPEWAVRLQPALHPETLKTAVLGIPLGGGTSIFPALDEAYGQLLRSRAQIKHVILISDGVSEPADFFGLAKAMHKDGITMTTVGVGLDADEFIMNGIATWGGGRYHFVNDVDHLPRIFTKETLLVGRRGLIEEPFSPLIASRTEVIQGIPWDRAPPLLGYNATSPKPLAEIPLVTHKGDPLLAHWRHGLGKSLAFTSDASSRWGARWLSWEGYGSLWRQAIRWGARHTKEDAYHVRTKNENGETRLTVDAVNLDGGFSNQLRLQAHIVSPALGQQTVALRQSGPGRYEGTFLTQELGIYLVTIGDESNQQAGSQSFGLSVPYSPEYRRVGINHGLLKRLAEETGGKYSPSPQEIFRHDLISQKTPIELWPWCLWLACLLFPLDVALRRILEPIPWVEHASTFVKRWMDFAQPEGASSASTTDLLARLRKRKLALKHPIVQSPDPAQPYQDFSAIPPTEGTLHAPAMPSSQETTSRLLLAKKRARLSDRSKTRQ